MEEFSIIIPSRPEFVTSVINFFSALLKDKGLKEPVISNVITSVIEAIANAINHGNKEDSSKKIAISVCFDRNKLSIEVQDEGDGFDVSNLPDPVAPENLLKPCGRGIFLMKSFMDSVDFDFQGKGLKVIMEKVFDREIE